MILFFVVLGAAGAWRIASVVPERSWGVDFSHYYTSSRILLDGGDPYASNLKREAARLGLDLEGLVEGATNPPPLVALQAPMAPLPPEWAYPIWTAIQIFCLAAFLWLVVCIAGLSGPGTIDLAGATLGPRGARAARDPLPIQRLCAFGEPENSESISGCCSACSWRARRRRGDTIMSCFSSRSPYFARELSLSRTPARRAALCYYRSLDAGIVRASSRMGTRIV